MKNLTICVAGIGASDFTVLMTDTLPDIQMNFNGQCFPMFLYDIAEGEQ